MTGYVLRRLAAALPLALAVASLVFVLMETAPGSPVDLALADPRVPPEVRERLEQIHGTDTSPVRRYVNWLGALVLHGDLGWSHSRSRPVAVLLREALPPTLTLAATALGLHILLGILLGVVSAAWRDRTPDRAVTFAGLIVYAMPTFWLGLMAILLLSYHVPLFPASSLESVGAADWPWPRRILDRAWHLALPALVLGVGSAAAMARFVRSGLLLALGQEFVRAARARGAGAPRVLTTHALRNALIPVINLIGLSLPALISGSLVIEVIFAWPGMGRLTYDAIRAQDFPVVLATTLLAAMMVVVGSLLADLAMALVDPRIRLRGAGGGAR
ncbi:MAG: ABC transporter permease [bacterium]|nr:ABC transporter permease [bacterium]